MQRLTPRFILPLILLAVYFVYHIGLNGPVIFDDALNIVKNVHIRIRDLSLASLREAAYSSPSGLFLRPLSMLSFALNFYFLDGNLSPTLFKLTNLVIHMLNGAGIYVLTCMLVSF